MKTQIFVQARMGATRLPGKVLLKLGGKSMISILVERLRRVKNIDKIILATSLNKENDPLLKEAKKLGIECFRGSEENVMDRFYQASFKFNPDNIIRITADCPLIDPDLINKGIDIFEKNNYDALSNVKVRTYPDGMDFEIFKAKLLEDSWKENLDKFGKEKFFKAELPPTDHFLARNSIKHKDFVNNEDLSRIRLTLDYKEDFLVIKKIYESLIKKNKFFGLLEILKFLKDNPSLGKLNEKYVCLDYGFADYDKRYKNQK